MSAEKILTQHPDKSKTGRLISFEKYEHLKENMLAVLSEKEHSHTDLMEAIYARVKDSFEGGVQWYAELVKLDLESREIIERTKDKPQKYRLK